jgi:hypothetical protein
MTGELPLPPHVDLERVSEVWRVDYEARFADANAWASEHGLEPAASDSRRVCLLAVDVQNTFCTPGFELFVAGRSGPARSTTTGGSARSSTGTWARSPRAW